MPNNEKSKTKDHLLSYTLYDRRGIIMIYFDLFILVEFVLNLFVILFTSALHYEDTTEINAIYNTEFRTLGTGAIQLNTK